MHRASRCLLGRDAPCLQRTDCSSELSRYDDFEDELFLRYYDVDPVEILQAAVDRSLNEAQAEGIVGSTTALLAVLRRDELRIANLGDCCCRCACFPYYVLFAVIDGRTASFVGARSSSGPKSSNTPSTIPSKSAQTDATRPRKTRNGSTSKYRRMMCEHSLFSDDERADIYHRSLSSPRTAWSITSSTKTSSKKFFDTLAILRRRRGRVSPSCASRLRSSPKRSANGRKPSRKISMPSPRRACALPVAQTSSQMKHSFQQKAMDEGMYHVGGKNDDITVLVSVVCDSEDSPVRSAPLLVVSRSSPGEGSSMICLVDLKAFLCIVH